MKRIIKKFAVNFLLILAGVCLTILLAEVFVRIFYPESRDHVLPSGLYESDKYLGWGLAKEKSAIHNSSYFSVDYATNSFGYRDKKRVIENENDNYRILLYGDSQVFGWGIPVEKRFSNLLENSISDLEIWNLAVPGYGLDQEILSYKIDGESFKADAVIFYISEYTVDRIKYAYIYKKYKPKFVEARGKLKVIPPKEVGIIKSLINTATFWMYLPFFLEKRFAIFDRELNVEGYLTKSIYNNDNDDKLSGLEHKLLLYAKDLAESRNDVMIILFNNYYPNSKELKNFCLRNNITYWLIDFDEKNNDFILGRMDGHWNMLANYFILKNLLPEIKQLNKEKSKY